MMSFLAKFYNIEISLSVKNIKVSMFSRFNMYNCGIIAYSSTRPLS